MSLHNPGTRHLPARKHSQGPHRPHPIGLVNGQQASIAMFTEFAGMLADITSRCTALTVVGLVIWTSATPLPAAKVPRLWVILKWLPPAQDQTTVPTQYASKAVTKRMRRLGDVHKRVSERELNPHGCDLRSY
jgi:hypothetical protein